MVDTKNALLAWCDTLEPKEIVEAIFNSQAVADNGLNPELIAKYLLALRSGAIAE